MRFSSCLTDQGLQLEIMGENLRVTPRSRITPEIREYIRSNRNFILDELRGNNPAIVSNTHRVNTSDSHPLNGCVPDIECLDSDECAAALIHFPGIGDLWVIFDERVRTEIETDGLPILTEEDFAHIKAGPTRQDRFTRLRNRVAVRHPTVIDVLTTFKGARITSVTLREGQI